jgi:hypothetical protein
MATYSSASLIPSTSNSYQNHNICEQKSVKNGGSPTFKAHSNTSNGYHPSYYAATNNVANSTGTANSLLNSAVKVSLISKNIFSKNIIVYLCSTIKNTPKSIKIE